MHCMQAQPSSLCAARWSTVVAQAPALAAALFILYSPRISQNIWVTQLLNIHHDFEQIFSVDIV